MLKYYNQIYKWLFSKLISILQIIIQSILTLSVIFIKTNTFSSKIILFQSLYSILITSHIKIQPKIHIMRSSKNRKSLEQQYFTGEQIRLLKTKSWWIANSQTPYLIKFTTHESSILMKCTNMEQLWVKKFTQNQIKQDQQVYVKGLTVKDFKHLLELFQGLLSDRDQKAEYKFLVSDNNDERSILIKFQKIIQFFPFLWKFKLQRVQYNIKQLICNQIINPLSFALQRQSKKYQVLRKRAQNLQKDYVRKMNETQKKMYKSPLYQNQQQWKIITKRQQGEYNNSFGNGFGKQLLIPFKYDGFVSYAIRQYLKPFVQEKPKVQIQTLLQARNKAQQQQPQKSPTNSKSNKPLLPIYNDEEEQMGLKLKYTKQDQKKNKNGNKKAGKVNLSIDFL